MYEGKYIKLCQLQRCPHHYCYIMFNLLKSEHFPHYISSRLGLDGETCLLRSICEISEFPMHIKEDDETLLEKIVHYAFTWVYGFVNEIGIIPMETFINYILLKCWFHFDEKVSIISHYIYIMDVIFVEKKATQKYYHYYYYFSHKFLIIRIHWVSRFFSFGQ